MPDTPGYSREGRYESEPGQAGAARRFDHSDFMRAVRDVEAAARRHGKAAGFMCADVAGGRALLEQGYRALAYGGDLWLYQWTLREGIAGLKGTG